MDKKKKKNDPRLRAYLSEVMQDNPTQGRALKVIFRGDTNLFITGKAGSGKTTFMKNVLPFLKGAVVVAPTGIAAINAGGATIHSFFRIPLDPYVPKIKNGLLDPQLKINGNMEFRNAIKNAKIIIIDEISMVRADLLDSVSDILQTVHNNNQPFGGIRLIMFGDLNQLPPVLKDSDADFYYDYYDSPYFFSSLALKKSGFEMIEFTKIYRQNDEVFVDLLNNIRNGKMTDEDINLLNSRCVAVPEGFEAIRAVSHNKIAQSVNESMLARIPAKSHTFLAKVVGQMPKETNCEISLSLKVGCQVVMTVNSKDQYVNGSLAIVTKIDPIRYEVSVRIIDTGGEFVVSPCVWESKKYSFVDGSLVSNVVGSVTQFPMKLGYALSIHKVQGMTFDRVIVDAGRSFTNGQVYVALSRCRTLENTYLTTPITNEQLIQDSRLVDFYKRSEELGGVFPPQDITRVVEDSHEIDIFEEFGL